MKTPQQIKNEVEKEIEELIKGCGEPYGIDEIDLTCYEDNLCDECENKLACCRDKLSILTEYDKSIKEMIEKRIKLVKSVRKEVDDIEKRFCDAKVEELNKIPQEIENIIINEVIRDERNLGQYARNEIPLSEFIKEAYDKGFQAGQKQSEDAFKEMIESCDEEPCCHGIQKNELLSQLNSKEKGE